LAKCELRRICTVYRYRYPILVINTIVQPCEQDILARKFVEHGEYEKAYYGTSIQAIRAVVSSEKICVLNLHPQARRSLFFISVHFYILTEISV